MSATQEMLEAAAAMTLMQAEIEKLRAERDALKFRQEEFHNIDDLVEIRIDDLVEIRELKAERDTAVARYEYVRKLNVRQFQTLWYRNLAGGERFDDMVDAAIDALKEKAK